MTLLLRYHLLPRSPFLSIIPASRQTALRLLTRRRPPPPPPSFLVTPPLCVHATTSASVVSLSPSLLPISLLPPDVDQQVDLDDDDGGSFPPTPIRVPLEKLFIPPEVDVSATDPSSFRILKGSNIVLSPYAKDAHVSQAEFVKSSTRQEDCPSDGRPEFALVGRSNVGKSSLLNSIVRRKQLAHISKKPGKTQCINHFLINNSWYLVDLPGYGYASAPQQARTNWNEFTRRYFLNRSTLVSVFLLIDASIPAKQIDLEYARWLGEHQPSPWIMTSSVTNIGRDEILLHMAQLRNYWQKH